MSELFLLAVAFGRIALGSFAGGLASIALIYHEIVVHYQWFTDEEFSKMISLAQMTPGPIAVNAATYVGKKLAGFPGAFVATTSVVATPLILLLIVSSTIRFLPLREETKQRARLSLRPGVAALLTASTLRLFSSTLERPIYLLLVPLAFFMLLNGRTGKNPSLAIVSCGLAAAIITLMLQIFQG